MIFAVFTVDKLLFVDLYLLVFLPISVYTGVLRYQPLRRWLLVMAGADRVRECDCGKGVNCPPGISAC